MDTTLPRNVAAEDDAPRSYVSPDGGLEPTDITADESPSADDRRRPAVGIVAAGEEPESVYRTILRAAEQGFAVYLIAVDPDSEPGRLAARLGAAVVEPRTVAASRLEFEAALFAAAYIDGRSGIIFQREGCPRIDYERTLGAFVPGRFETDAIPEARPVVDRRPRVLAAIPAYNAAETIGSVVREATTHADQVLVVDDGSDDATAERAEGAGALVVRHDRNRGYGGALQTIFAEGRTLAADHLVTLDADGQHDPASIATLVEAQESSGAEIVIGSRFADDSKTRMPRVRSLGLGVINLLTNASLGRFRPRTWVRDTQSGFRSYTWEAVDSLATTADLGSGMGASTDIIYHAHRAGFDFEEIGITIDYDVEHGSSQGALSHGTGLVWNILGHLEWTHPLLVLGLPGTLLAALGTSIAVGSIEQLSAAQVPAISILAPAAFAFAGVTMVLFALFVHAMNTHPSLRSTPYRERSERVRNREDSSEGALVGATVAFDGRP
ncbi:glycosyltransferase family 2 protein [Halosolutus gelatinilyticus]|uniref:glycosyltransferase family 2 protein n=1 Tax=Halosolutus gelatinilyticus TaxID=2931975 RepID=UPI001FF2E6FC|nr:glycosyltransferase family 2 protein [Halosolutus gelatinilyticus]